MQRCVALALVVAAAPAIADAPQPRAVGRAGTGVVADDGLGAIVVSPAALARRDQRRGQLAVAVVDDDAEAAALGRRTARSLQSPQFALGLAVVDAVGPVVVGAALTTSDVGRQLAAPSLDPTTAALVPERYAGLAARRQEQAFTVAVAARVNDVVAVGVAATVASARLEERRRLWAGFTGRDVLGDPRRDLDLALTADDHLVPGASFGVLAAPAALPLELAASVTWRNGVDARGPATAQGVAGELAVDAAAAEGRLRLPAPTVVRVGARWLASRWEAEIDAEYHLYVDAAARPAWELEGLRVVDRAGPAAAITRVPSRAGRVDHGAVRGAADVAVVPGQVWASAGVAWAQAASPDRAVAVPWGDLGGVTAALGVEVSVADVALALGWSRTWASARTVDASDLGYDNPFGAAAGDVGAGRFDGAIDRAAVTLEVAWP